MDATLAFKSSCFPFPIPSKTFFPDHKRILLLPWSLVSQIHSRAELANHGLCGKSDDNLLRWDTTTPICLLTVWELLTTTAGLSSQDEDYLALYGESLTIPVLGSESSGFGPRYLKLGFLNPKKSTPTPTLIALFLSLKPRQLELQVKNGTVLTGVLQCLLFPSTVSLV